MQAIALVDCNTMRCVVIKILAYNGGLHMVKYVDNTVGSLTQLQRSVIIGSILGDGYLRRLKGRRDAFLEINHSFNQKDYVDWKFRILQSITVGQPTKRLGNGNRVAYRFYTQQHPELTEIMEMFYQDGKKIITNLKLDPIILAVWYMDDGSMCRESDVYLNTQQFDRKSQLTLLKILQGLGLEATLNKDKVYYRIRFLKSSVPQLKVIVREHVIPSMQYKLGYDPVETDPETERAFVKTSVNTPTPA